VSRRPSGAVALSSYRFQGLKTTAWCLLIMKILLVNPPLLQLNTPYPATAYLAGHLRRCGYSVRQADLGLIWVLRLFSQAGVQRILAALESEGSDAHPSVVHLRENAERVLACIDPVIAFLQGRQTGLERRIAGRTLLPEGKRFAELGPVGHEQDYLDFAFGAFGVADKAKYFASLFIEDLADAITHGIDSSFELSRYGSKLSQSPPSIEPLLEAMASSPLTATCLNEVTLELLEQEKPDVVGLSVPFPGSLLGALRIASIIRTTLPLARIIMGGGWVNTEFRDLCEPRLFDFVDAVTYDDGERPLECLLEYFAGRREREQLLRTRLRVDGEVRWFCSSDETDIPFSQTANPTYDGLPLCDYLGIVDFPNPMHRLWGDTRWNKLTVAHGCYWKKCTFCDLSLDYISRYEPLSAMVLADRMEALIAETGYRGFHFVDEAAPPKVLAGLAKELLRRHIVVSWWGNIRFDPYFTPEVCKLLADSGCIAVTGGLEAAQDRLLALMQKGVSVKQVARVAKAFANSGILVHAYLIYGFPSQTEQETIDSLEYVRQLFVEGCLDSAHWHRLAVAAHAPIGQDPAAFGIKLVPTPTPTFARNDLQFVDPVGTNHDRLGLGLNKAIYNYMRGLGLDDDVRAWFDFAVPQTSVPSDYVEKTLGGRWRL